MMNRQLLKKPIFYGLSILAASVISCSHNLRTPSNLSAESLLDEVFYLTKSDLKDSKACVFNFKTLSDRLFHLEPNGSYEFIKDNDDLLALINRSFELRLALKDLIPPVANERISSDCISAMSKMVSSLRYGEDYMIEEYEKKKLKSADQYVTLTGDESYFLVNPKYKNEFKSYKDLKSGDVILSRGNAYISATIARVAEIDYQFSHMSFVYIDDKTKEMKTTEAHIEIGSVVENIKLHIDSKNARTVVFRYKDPQISHQASKYVHDVVLKRQKTKKNILYDFSMNHIDNSKLYCSEIVTFGFKNVLKDEDYFPLYKSKFNPGSVNFLKSIGVGVTSKNVDTFEVFAPGDIQFDPRFEIIAEWRNPAKIQTQRFKDFILSKIFEKIENEKYRFDDTIVIDAQSKAIWLARRLPVVKKFLEKKVPINMSAKQVEITIALDKVGEEIELELNKIQANHGRPMTPKEILSAIDEIFVKDFKSFKSYKKNKLSKKPKFHKLFHP